MQEKILLRSSMGKASMFVAEDMIQKFFNIEDSDDRGKWCEQGIILLISSYSS
jgi:hypothetical protein